MSTQDAAAPESIGLRLGTIVRIAAILLGIASAVLLAHSAFGIRFNQDFVLFLNIVRDAVGIVVLPFELLIVNPVVGWLREHGFMFQLHPHWHYVFVLLWLFSASVSRAFNTSSVEVALSWVVGVFAAMLGAALAGTVPLDHEALLWWAIAGFFAQRSAINFVGALTESREMAAHGVLALCMASIFVAFALGWVHPPAVVGSSPIFWSIAAYFIYLAGIAFIPFTTPYWSWVALLLALVAVASALALGVLPEVRWLDFRQSPSPGLANLAVFVAVLGAWYILYGFLEATGSARFLQRSFGSGFTRAGIDVLAVLGGAVIIVYLAHLMA